MSAGPPTPIPLPNWTILLVEVGSTAHGTGIPDGEDLDEIGVFVETQSQVFGPGPSANSSMHRTQPDGVRSGPGDIDLTLHPLRRFLRLASTGNPSIMMCLWSPVMLTTPMGDELRELGMAFVGRHVIPRYRGYMASQGSRLLGVGGGKHGKRGGGQRPELIEAHGFDTKYAMHCSRLGYQCIELLTTGHLALPMADPAGSWLRRLRAGEISFDEWWETTLDVDAQCEQLEADASIRPGADLEAISAFSTRAHLSVWAE
jgi:uncharacterized protein